MFTSNRKSLNSLILAILVSTVFLNISACSDNKPKDEIPEYITDEFREDFPEKFKSLPNEKLNFPPEAPLDDAEFWREPRVQFVWRKQRAKPTDKDLSDYVFSMKLDGSDIRLAAGPEELFPEKSGTIGYSLLKRSPNNRYLAYYDGFHYLLDLETKERIQMTNKRGGSIAYLWSGDNQTVFFKGNREMKQYHIPTRTLKPLLKNGKDEFFPWPRFTLDNGKALVYLDKYIHKLNFDGNLIKKIARPLCSEKSSGGYWMVNDWMRLYACDDKRYIYSVKDNRVIDVSTTVEYFYHSQNKPTFNPYDLDAYHYNKAGVLSKINIVTLKTKSMINKDIKTRGFSIINYPQIRYQN